MNENNPWGFIAEIESLAENLHPRRQMLFGMQELAPFAPELPKLAPPTDYELEAMAAYAGASCYECVRAESRAGRHKVETASAAYRGAH